jgi:hypothetical protein
MRIYSIYYNPNENAFEDEDGDTIDIISNIISVTALAEFKEIGGIYYFDSVDEDIRYEVVFPINDLDRTLYYDVEANLMYDECGKEMFNIFSLIRPNDLYLFKKNKETMEVYGRNGGLIELVWPDCKP